MVIIGVLLIPVTTMPVTKAADDQIPAVRHRGDIIFADGGYLPGVRGWDHAALYTGGGHIMEADPHAENWTRYEKYVLWGILHDYEYFHQKSYQGIDPKHYGEVESDTLTQTFSDYDTVSYAEVTIASTTQMGEAADFAEGKEHRPFDYLSYWEEDKKQVDGLSGTLGYGYYCAELVWAAYYHYPLRINLDPDGPSAYNRISPQQIADYESRVNIYNGPESAD